MNKALLTYIYTFLFAIGLKLFYDLNHEFHWFLDLDKVFGVSYALFVLVPTFTIYRITKSIPNKRIKACIHFFFFLALMNFFDELIFDPCKFSFSEWIFGLLSYLILNQYYKKK